MISPISILRDYVKNVVSQDFSFYFKHDKEEVSGRFDLFPLPLAVGSVFLTWPMAKL